MPSWYQKTNNESAVHFFNQREFRRGVNFTAGPTLLADTHRSGSFNRENHTLRFCESKRLQFRTIEAGRKGGLSRVGAAFVIRFRADGDAI